MYTLPYPFTGGLLAFPLFFLFLIFYFLFLRFFYLYYFLFFLLLNLENRTWDHANKHHDDRLTDQRWNQRNICQLTFLSEIAAQDDLYHSLPRTLMFRRFHVLSVTGRLVLLYQRKGELAYLFLWFQRWPVSWSFCVVYWHCPGFDFWWLATIFLLPCTDYSFQGKYSFHVCGCLSLSVCLHVCLFVEVSVSLFVFSLFLVPLDPQSSSQAKK